MSRPFFILAIVGTVFAMPIVFWGRKGAGLIILNVSFWLFLAGTIIYFIEARKNENK